MRSGAEGWATSAPTRRPWSPITADCSWPAPSPSRPAASFTPSCSADEPRPSTPDGEQSAHQHQSDKIIGGGDPEKLERPMLMHGLADLDDGDKPEPIEKTDSGALPDIRGASIDDGVNQDESHDQ